MKRDQRRLSGKETLVELIPLVAPIVALPIAMYIFSSLIEKRPTIWILVGTMVVCLGVWFGSAKCSERYWSSRLGDSGPENDGSRKNTD